ncbi:MAG: YgjP-like metallopeptidase domain-containing protein [Ghiorsea sp.]
MRPKPIPNYLAGYSDELTRPVNELLVSHKLGGLLLQKYPCGHDVRTDKALYDFIMDLKSCCLRKAGQLDKVAFDTKLHITHNALGIHTSKSSAHGGKLKAKRSIHVAAMFKDMPPEFLRMIVVHELAHFKEQEHNKAFYQLCCHMEPSYHQLEFDVRIYLTYLAAGGEPLWSLD